MSASADARGLNMQVKSFFTVAIVAFMLIGVVPAPAGAAAPVPGDATYSGVIAGATFGLHGSAVHPARATHFIDLPEGVVGVTFTVASTDLIEYGGYPELVILGPDGERVARAAPRALNTLDLPWSVLAARGFGTYAAVIDCGECGVIVYELTVSVRTDPYAFNVTADETRLLTFPGAGTTTSVTVTNAGVGAATVALATTPLPPGWSAVIEPATVSVVSGENATVDLTVSVSPEADLTAPVTFTLVASSEERTVASAFEARSDAGIAALRARGHAIIALIDTGINPYHEEFRGPGSFGDHPAWFVDDYPGSAQPLHLTLDAATYSDAKASDAGVWSQVRGDVLYYVPGTRIVGMICIGGCTNLDEGGHGTGTASLAAGATLGEAPEALIVSVTGDIFGGARWAARQGWIDVISMSLGLWAGGPTVGVNDPVSGGTGNPYVPFSMPAAQKTAWESGKRWFSGSAGGWGAWADTRPASGGAVDVAYGASGPSPNGGHSSFSGSPWTFAVEPFWPDNEQTWRSQGFSPDMVANGWDLVAASGASLTGTNSFGHASGATPQPAGMYARLVMEARRILDAAQEGPRGDILAEAGPAATLPTSGPLADGVLTVQEAESVLLHALEQVNSVESAEEHGFDEEAFDRSMVTLPFAEYATQGWGLLTDDARALASAVLRGDADSPFRPTDDAFYAASFAARHAVWDAHVRGEIWVF